ncbi:MAG: AraC family transcriptional regulator [Lachnospiraceae bacterium]|nr:AraC family transcriptional regulator [Lachnospiraceae bacterium]
MPNFKLTPLTEEINVTDIITIHYFEYSSDFYFPGEHHDFWEFLCVDKGEVIVMADEQEHILKKGDIIFHKPNEFHNVRANGTIAPNLVVIAFYCDSPSMEYFHNKILKIGESERTLLAHLITEALHTFSSRLDDPYLNELECKEEAPFGSLQLIKTNLEQLLIRFIRKDTESTYRIESPMDTFEGTDATKKTVKQKNDQQLCEQLIAYLQENIDKQLTIDQICQELHVGSSQVQKIFNEQSGCGIINYFSRMKIAAAKEHIRANHMNFTQISDALGYSSVHYFSRQFKKIAGMTPSEYAYSVKVISDGIQP